MGSRPSCHPPPHLRNGDLAMILSPPQVTPALPPTEEAPTYLLPRLSPLEVAPPPQAEQPPTVGWPAFLASDWAPSLPIPLEMEFLLFTEPQARTPQSLLPSSTGKLLALAAPVLGLTSPLKTPLVPALFQSPSQTVSPSRMKTECCYFCSTSPRPGQATEGQIGVQAVSLHPWTIPKVLP